MQIVHVTIQDGYPVYIGCQIIEQLPKLLRSHSINQENKLVCITDSNVAPFYLVNLTRQLLQHEYSIEQIIIPAGEDSKTIKTIEYVVGKCLEYQLNRQSVILALGGGVVGDIAGFVAATYMRGIRYVHIPTTIIAHDSSIGGKVGINHTMGKNVIGAFHQPEFVLFDVSFLETLPFDERISGYAEMIKHALIRDENFCKWLHENNEHLISLQLVKVQEAIYRSCAIKAAVVSSDENEKGIRMILNYGHTIGHALETVTKYNRYKHGEAISIGMCGAAYLSELLYSESVLKETAELLNAFRLPTCFNSSHSDEQLLAIMKNDKKQKNEKYTFVLSSKIGNALIAYVEEKHVRDVLQKIKKC